MPNNTNSTLDVLVNPIRPSPSPACGRQQSYTHSFPASRTSTSASASTSAASASASRSTSAQYSSVPLAGPPRRGLSPATLALAKQAFDPASASIQTQSQDRLGMFFNGLQWLLDSTVEGPSHDYPQARRQPRQTPLTQDALRSYDYLNSQGMPQVKEVSGSSEADGEQDEHDRTAAWLSSQSAGASTTAPVAATAITPPP